MVQSWYGGWNIWVYIESAWESHIVLLCEWLQNYFQTKKNPSEGSDVRSSKKREQQIRQQPQCQLLPSDRCLVCEKTWIQENNMLKTLVNCVSKTAEEKLITMPPVGEITLEGMTDIRKSSKTLKPLKSKLPTRPYKNIFSTSFSMLLGESFRAKEITTLRKNYETGAFHASSQ